MAEMKEAEMVERVAKEIATQCRRRSSEAPPFGESSWRDDDYCIFARVVIATMLNPTEAMVDAGEDASPLDEPEAVWLAMINAALATGDANHG